MPFDNTLVERGSQMTLRELTEVVGVAPRQVRYMIAEGFVPPPVGGRAHASYGEEHVEAIRRYMRLRGLGFTPCVDSGSAAGRGRRADSQWRDGITLVVPPELFASGEPVEPLLRRIEALLREDSGLAWRG